MVTKGPDETRNLVRLMMSGGGGEQESPVPYITELNETIGKVIPNDVREEHWPSTNEDYPSYGP